MKKPIDLEAITKILMPDETHPSDFESLHGFVLCGYAEKTDKNQVSDTPVPVKLVMGQYFYRPEGSAEGLLEAHFLNDSFDYIRTAIADRILSAMAVLIARRVEEPESLYEAAVIVKKYNEKFGLEARARENGDVFYAELIAFMRMLDVDIPEDEQDGVKQPPIPPLDS